MVRPGSRFFRIASAALLLAVGGALGFHRIAPDVPALEHRNPGMTRMMELRVASAAARGETLRIRQEWVPFERISPHLWKAVVAAEDRHFFKHRGVDFKSLWKATLNNIRGDGITQGASTITQQVAKNLYLNPRKTYSRKVKELAVSLRMEGSLSKERILEIYLNTAEWGKGIFGAEAAARTFFGKSARDLSFWEGVSLAAVLPSPLRHSPAADGEFLELRKALILRKMKRNGYLSEEEFDRLMATLPRGRLHERVLVQNLDRYFKGP